MAIKVTLSGGPPTKDFSVSEMMARPGVYRVNEADNDDRIIVFERFAIRLDSDNHGDVYKFEPACWRDTRFSEAESSITFYFENS